MTTGHYIECHRHGIVQLTESDYRQQLSNANARWHCPICSETADWVDDEPTFEQIADLFNTGDDK